MKTPALIASIISCAAVASAAEPFQKTLISARDGVRVDTLEISGRDVTPQRAGWSVRKLTLHGGKQEGVDVIIVDNGKLQFTVVPTRGMGVLSVTCGDVRQRLVARPWSAADRAVRCSRVTGRG